MDVRRVSTALGGYPFAVLLVAVVSLVLLPFRPLLQPTTVMLLFIPVIITTGRFAGSRPSAASALMSFLALDLLFVPPYYHLNAASLPEWLGLVVFLVVALVSGQQTGVLRQRERAALSRQRELEFLNRLSFQIASERSAPATAEFIVGEVTRTLGARRAALYLALPDSTSPTSLAEAGDPKPVSAENALVAWVMRAGCAVGLPLGGPGDPNRPPESVDASAAIAGVSTEGYFLPLQTTDSLEGVLFVLPSLGIDRAEASDPRLFVAIANLAATSLERQRLVDEAAKATALAEADRLKTTLVSSVSHELKTPLAAATARVTGLLEEDAPNDPVRVRAELGEVAQDLDRLNASIGALLDLSRLEADEWRPVLEPEELSDVLGTVLSRLAPDQRDRVVFELSENLPRVLCDFAQLARALANLIENALAYSPAGSPVTVGASALGDDVAVWVQDAGPGVADAEKTRVFEKFYRGERSASAPGGTGLGLAIAKEIVRSHEGALRVEDAEPHGARFVMTLRRADAEGGE